MVVLTALVPGAQTQRGHGHALRSCLSSHAPPPRHRPPVPLPSLQCRAQTKTQILGSSGSRHSPAGRRQKGIRESLLCIYSGDDLIKMWLRTHKGLARGLARAPDGHPLPAPHHPSAGGPLPSSPARRLVSSAGTRRVGRPGFRVVSRLGPRLGDGAAPGSGSVGGLWLPSGHRRLAGRPWVSGQARCLGAGSTVGLPAGCPGSGPLAHMPPSLTLEGELGEAGPLASSSSAPLRPPSEDEGAFWHACGSWAETLSPLLGVVRLLRCVFDPRPS